MEADKQIGLHLFLHFKENHDQNIKTSHRIEESFAFAPDKYLGTGRTLEGKKIQYHKNRKQR